MYNRSIFDVATLFHLDTDNNMAVQLSLYTHTRYVIRSRLLARPEERDWKKLAPQPLLPQALFAENVAQAVPRHGCDRGRIIHFRLERCLLRGRQRRPLPTRACINAALRYQFSLSSSAAGTRRGPQPAKPDDRSSYHRSGGVSAVVHAVPGLRYGPTSGSLSWRKKPCARGLCSHWASKLLVRALWRRGSHTHTSGRSSKAAACRALSPWLLVTKSS